VLDLGDREPERQAVLAEDLFGGKRDLVSPLRGENQVREDPSTLVNMSIVRAVQLAGELPGEDLVRSGMDDLRRGEATVEAMLVSIGAPRLRLLGLEIPETVEAPEDALFALLERDVDDAHSRYNALIRRLVSFERAAECLV
jgi:hypothetical protein